MIVKCCLLFLNRKVGKEKRGCGKILGVLYNITIEYNKLQPLITTDLNTHCSILIFTKAGYGNGIHYILQVFPILGPQTIWACRVIQQQQKKKFIAPYWLNVFYVIDPH